MQADSEFDSLIEMRCQELQHQKQARNSGTRQSNHSLCLIAVCSPAVIQQLDQRLIIASEAVVGTLDLHVAQAPAGQALIGVVFLKMY